MRCWQFMVMEQQRLNELFCTEGANVHQLDHSTTQEQEVQQKKKKKPFKKKSKGPKNTALNAALTQQHHMTSKGPNTARAAVLTQQGRKTSKACGETKDFEQSRSQGVSPSLSTVSSETFTAPTCVCASVPPAAFKSVAFDSSFP